MKTQHLTDRQVGDYLAKRLPPEQIPAFHLHTETCPSCAELLRITVTGTGEDHLAEQEAVDFVAGLLPNGRKTRVADHLKTCECCAAMVADLEEFRESDELRPVQTVHQARSRKMLWALPAAALVMLAAGISMWFALRPGNSQPKVVAELRDAGGVFQVNQDGRLVAQAALPADARDLLATALRTGHLPSGPAELPTATQQILRSAVPAAPVSGFKILSPDGVRVLADRPEFRWQTLAGASAYKITVTDEDLNVVARSNLIHLRPGEEAVWIPEAPLPREKPLLWQVAALRLDAWVIVPQPPEVHARFEIVSTDFAARVAEARAANPPSHLYLAILYSQAGLRKEATAEVDAIATLNPGSSLAASLGKNNSAPR